MTVMSECPPYPAVGDTVRVRWPDGHEDAGRVEGWGATIDVVWVRHPPSDARAFRLRVDAGAWVAEPLTPPPSVRLSPDVTESAPRPQDLVTAPIRTLAAHVFGSQGAGETWLDTPHAWLGGVPRQLAATPDGEQRVRAVLLAIEFGLPA